MQRMANSNQGHYEKFKRMGTGSNTLGMGSTMMQTQVSKNPSFMNTGGPAGMMSKFNRTEIGSSSPFRDTIARGLVTGPGLLG